MFRNWGGNLGEPSLICVNAGMDVIRAPYVVNVRYDLKPLIGKLAHVEAVCLAALDAEKLRRRGSGMGLDALQASSSWIARDCSCLKTGKLRALPSWKTPGTVRITLCPTSLKDRPETCVLLRVVLIRHPEDDQDWHAVGAPVVIRCDTTGKLMQPEPHQLQPQMREMLTHVGLHDSVDKVDGSRPEYWGIRVQQMVDFCQEIKEDMRKYCTVHKVCSQPGRYHGFHVCTQEPCPFRAHNMARLDDHRGAPCVRRSQMEAVDADMLDELTADVHFVANRYIKPRTHGTGKGLASLMNPTRPLRASAFVSHAWSANFEECVETIASALTQDDTIFMAAFALDLEFAAEAQHVSFEPDPRDYTGPCSRALHGADKLLFLVDRAMSSLQRMTCLLEASHARALLTPTFIWPHKSVDLTDLSAAVASLDVACAEASGPDRMHRLLEVMAREDDPEFMAVSRELADFLGSRLACFSAAVQQAVDLQCLTPERLRFLQARQERATILREVDRDQKERVADFSTMVASMDSEIVGLRADSKSLTAVQAEEFAELGVEQKEFEQQRERRLVTEANQAKAHSQFKQDELEDLSLQLASTRRRVAEMRRALSRRQERVQELRQSVAQASERVAVERHRAEQLAAVAEEEMKRLDEERQRRESRAFAAASAEERLAELTKGFSAAQKVLKMYRGLNQHHHRIVENDHEEEEEEEEGLEDGLDDEDSAKEEEKDTVAELGGACEEADGDDGLQRFATNLTNWSTNQVAPHDDEGGSPGSASMTINAMGTKLLDGTTAVLDKVGASAVLNSVAGAGKNIMDGILHPDMPSLNSLNMPSVPSKLRLGSVFGAPEQGGH